MHVIADDFDIHRSGIEVLKLKFTHAAAVDGIGPFGVKGCYIKVFRPFAHLFVWCKSDANIAMRNIFMLQYRQRGHDFRHTRFVVRPQQRFAVGGDQRLTKQLMQHREHHRRQHFITNAQRDITAAIVLHDLRIHVLTAEIR